MCGHCILITIPHVLALFAGIRVVRTAAFAFVELSRTDYTLVLGRIEVTVSLCGWLRRRVKGLWATPGQPLTPATFPASNVR